MPTKNTSNRKPTCGCSIGDLSEQSQPMKKSQQAASHKKSASVASSIAQEAANLELFKDNTITAEVLEPIIEVILQIGDSAMDNLAEQLAEKIADKVAERVETLLTDTNT